MKRERFSVCGGERLGEDAHLAYDGHEICVAVPARHDVHVQVLVYAGAGDFADVHADVESVRLHELRQGPDALLRERRHLCEFIRSQRREVRCVAVGHDHQVSRVVGVRVHDYETMRAPLDYHAYLVLVAFRKFAEDAAFHLFRAVGVREYVLRAPRREYLFHKAISS